MDDELRRMLDASSGPILRPFDAFCTIGSDGMGIGLSVSRSITESRHGGLGGAQRRTGRHVVLLDPA